MKVGYARVSTEDQSLDLQIDALRRDGCEKIFEDRMSGAKTERPGLTAALDYVREGDSLVVWKLDRLGRSLKHLIETVEGLRERGVEFKSLNDSIDTTTAAGRMFFHIIGAIAEFERALIQERTLAGLSAARARGRRGGRRKVLSGDKLKIAATLAADPTQTVAGICQHLGISRQTFYNYFPKNQTSAGNDRPHHEPESRS